MDLKQHDMPGMDEQNTKSEVLTGTWEKKIKTDKAEDICLLGYCSMYSGRSSQMLQMFLLPLPSR
jgi:hypothetical protein